MMWVVCLFVYVVSLVSVASMFCLSVVVIGIVNRALVVAVVCVVIVVVGIAVFLGAGGIVVDVDMWCCERRLC